MQFTFGSTFSKFLFVALLTCAVVVQGAPVEPYLGIRSSIVDVANDGLARRVHVARDDMVADLAALKRELLPRTDALYFRASEYEERKTEGDNLARRVEGDVWYFLADE